MELGFHFTSKAQSKSGIFCIDTTASNDGYIYQPPPPPRGAEYLMSKGGCQKFKGSTPTPLHDNPSSSTLKTYHVARYALVSICYLYAGRAVWTRNWSCIFYFDGPRPRPFGWRWGAVNPWNLSFIPLDYRAKILHQYVVERLECGNKWGMLQKFGFWKNTNTE